MATQTLTLRKLSPAIGAIAEGIDLAQPLDPDNIAAIQQALVTHHVLFFQNQTVTPAIQREIASHFGSLHIHPIYPNVKEVPEVLILDNSEENLPDNDTWHTDVTFIQTPPLGSVLAAKLLPPTGGDTCWSSSIAAYQALSEPFKSFLDGLTAVHNITKAFPFERWGKNKEHYEEVIRSNPPVVHPVVRVHPVTGKKGIFVNEGFTTHIVELSKTESDAVLRMLFAHNAKPEFMIRWHWSVGDVAIWDNRLSQHYAIADYLPHRRVMHRATILGDRPRGPGDEK